ncbi:MAG: response regulator transcription factor [Bacteroidales bacterium]|nr:response regulator transcription factor [Bacteroidales bacterium]
MNINCIIVEDEPLSQDILEKYIHDHKNLNLVAICNDATEAGIILRDYPVELIFLDINMPGISGLQLIKSLSHPPMVIFTTAYPEFALEGFEVAAIDYLLKPFSFDRFLIAVNKAMDRVAAEKRIKTEENILWLKSDKKINRINIDDIIFVEALGDYVKITCKSGNIIVHDTMQVMNEKLKDSGFLRIHRSYIVSSTKIDYVEGNHVKIGNVLLPIGLSYREVFFRRLKH